MDDLRPSSPAPTIDDAFTYVPPFVRISVTPHPDGAGLTLSVGRALRSAMWREAILPPLVPFNSTEWPWKTDPSGGKGPASFEELHKAGLLKP